ncbi:hypothetical protein [Mycolicibacterium smegmatis]|nr:putative secreted protein [Mycolicibacterium smegmatis]SUA34959.1 putative secreted protein [Mycolicibacterium smegmatis]VTP10929.1 hypothetical protein BIN_B_05274 [Mycolicibacterium smegmatis]
MRVVLATGSVAAAICLPVPAHADPAPLHQVTYTVTAQTPTRADIYYRETDPPNWADYSHNPYVFSPKAEVEVGPGAPWVLTVQLADPDRWAMVSATSGRGPATPAFHCELAVDGVVVATGDGPKGALCAVRHW